MKIIHETQTNLSHKTIHVLIDVIINFVEFIFFLLFSLSNKSINTCMYILPVEKNPRYTSTQKNMFWKRDDA